MTGLIVGLLVGLAVGWLLGLWRCRVVVRRVRKPLIAARVVERHLQPEMNRRDRRAAARRAAKAR